MDDSDDTIYLSVDPGIKTGGIALIRFIDDHGAFLLRHETLDLGKDDTSVPPFIEATRTVAGSAEVDEFLIEFPSAAYHGNQNGAIMVGVCRVAAEVAAWGAYQIGSPEFFGANRLRRSGHVIANDKRPTLYRRIFDEEAPTEHVRDAALIAAKHHGVL